VAPGRIQGEVAFRAQGIRASGQATGRGPRRWISRRGGGCARTGCAVAVAAHTAMSAEASRIRAAPICVRAGSMVDGGGQNAGVDIFFNVAILPVPRWGQEGLGGARGPLVASYRKDVQHYPYPEAVAHSRAAPSNVRALSARSTSARDAFSSRTFSLASLANEIDEEARAR
jgi:hypothetical protein